MTRQEMLEKNGNWETMSPKEKLIFVAALVHKCNEAYKFASFMENLGTDELKPIGKELREVMDEF